jgi:hypothetical protein
MGCNCGRGRGKPRRRLPVHPVKVKSRSIPKAQKRYVKPKPAKAREDMCGSCGWLMAGSRYYESGTNRLVTKWVCQNRRCPAYNKGAK